MLIVSCCVDCLCREFCPVSEAYRPRQHTEGSHSLPPVSKGDTAESPDSLVLAGVLLAQPVEGKISSPESLSEQRHKRGQVRAANSSQTVSRSSNLQSRF